MIIGQIIGGEAINRLAEYEDLEEDRRLIRLPCKVGDIVYHPSYKFTKCNAYDYVSEYAHDSNCEGCEVECDSTCNPYIYVGEVAEIRVLSTGVTVRVRFTEKFDASYYTIGKTVFLSYEEAERNLVKS